MIRRAAAGIARQDRLLRYVEQHLLEPVLTGDIQFKLIETDPTGSEIVSH